MYRTLFISKQSSAPISDFVSNALTRDRRARRNRSKSMRSSQSTAIGPYVFNATMVLLFPRRLVFSAECASCFEYRLSCWHSNIFERRRKRNGNMHCAHAFNGCFQAVKRSLGNNGSELAGHAVSAVTFVNYDGLGSFFC